MGMEGKKQDVHLASGACGKHELELMRCSIGAPGPKSDREDDGEKILGAP